MERFIESAWEYSHSYRCQVDRFHRTVTVSKPARQLPIHLAKRLTAMVTVSAATTSPAFSLLAGKSTASFTKTETLIACALSANPVCWAEWSMSIKTTTVRLILRPQTILPQTCRKTFLISKQQHP